MPKNNAAKRTILSVVITAIGIAMAFAGIILDDYNFYWMIMSGLLGLTFLIAFFMFAGQPGRLDRIFRNSGLLARWSFNPSEHHPCCWDHSGNRLLDDAEITGANYV